MSWTTSPPPSVVCFDLDDTIIDFGGNVDATLHEVCAEAAGRRPGLDPAALHAAIQRERAWFWSDPDRHRAGRADLLAATTEIVARALAGLGHDKEADASAIARRFRDLRTERIVVFEGAIETLTWLADRGVRLALVTNGTAAEQRAKLERFALARHFEHIAIEGEAGVGKPDVRAYELALGALTCDAGDCWMVGDNLEWDVAAPQAVGMRAVWVDALGAGLPEGCAITPDHVVRSIRELVPPAP
jgi:putative hydrolase of the HAD superfamily